MAELRVLTYNVRSLRDDAAAVARVIRSCEPDVVAIQEAPRTLRWRSKRAALARTSGLVVATADRPGGLMLMTSIAVTVQATRFALLPKSPDLHQRAVCVADVVHRGLRWTVASVHFSLDADERRRHLDALWPALRTDRPLVVAGDVNEPPGGPVWDELTARLRDAYAEAPVGPELTFSVAKPRRRIDVVLVSPGVEVVECRTVDTPDVRGASDHHPVLAVLRSPEAS